VTGGSSGVPTLIVVVIAVLATVVFLVITLTICIIILRMHRRTADMDVVLSSMQDATTDSPSLGKKHEDTELDAKASAPAMLGGPDLTKDELEDNEHWHELLPREGRSSVHSLKRRDSRDSTRGFSVGGVVRALKRSYSRDSHLGGGLNQSNGNGNCRTVDLDVTSL
jgi:hypothetical protein